MAIKIEKQIDIDDALRGLEDSIRKQIESIDIFEFESVNKYFDKEVLKLVKEVLEERREEIKEEILRAVKNNIIEDVEDAVTGIIANRLKSLKINK